MIEKMGKRDYLEILFLRENCGYDGSDDCRRYILRKSTRTLRELKLFPISHS